jgi:glutamate 5-kinase
LEPIPNQRNESISRGKIEDIGMQIAALNEYEFVIVSSGAIAAQTICKTGKKKAKRL